MGQVEKKHSQDLAMVKLRQLILLLLWYAPWHGPGGEQVPPSSARGGTQEAYSLALLVNTPVVGQKENQHFRDPATVEVMQHIFLSPC